MTLLTFAMWGTAEKSLPRARGAGYCAREANGARRGGFHMMSSLTLVVCCGVHRAPLSQVLRAPPGMDGRRLESSV